jgi:hypothetical protein
MKNFSFLAVSTLLLAGCASSAPPPSPALTQQLQNPLYAKQYYTELIDAMVDIEINEPAFLSGATMRTTLTRIKDDALAKAQEEEKKIRTGLNGSFVPLKQEVSGLVLLMGKKLRGGPRPVATRLSDDRRRSPGRRVS